MRVYFTSAESIAFTGSRCLHFNPRIGFAVPAPNDYGGCLAIAPGYLILVQVPQP